MLRKWDEYFATQHIKNLEVRFVIPFAYRSNNVFNHSGNYIFGWRIFNNELAKFIGILNLAVYLMFTKADKVIVLSPKYIALSHRFKRIFHKHYQIINWVHFSLNQVFSTDNKQFKSADYHLAISTGIKQQLLDMGIDRKRIFVVFNPIEKAKYQIPASQDPRYVYVGRLEYRHQKNLQELLHGFAMLKKQLPNASLDLWGSGQDMSKLRELVTKLDVSQVNFKGWNKNPWSQIKSVTAFVLTSTYEGLPMSILEAISHGVPVISADILTGPSDEITGENGLLYKTGDVAELRDEMIEVFENRQNYRSKAMKASISKYYSKNYFANLIKILQEMG
ncbi:hypothetical protein BTM29_05135 [Companilactobacillus allii]|uniref:Glycosyl transferase family 1 domain-containing protein n=1 Tax=Companilactobacillus allii TaxID=1847728 RepID=A0A1P8Q2D6_9LACO|nr:hypothetical protein BTM29_05135 [Companilactobacillus allii]